MVYLKSIDAIGFKSFADHTNVQFDKGVTAIVGPNGSGKSNITDAIKWVLGEQSAKSLRGSKMEDIIFSGAEHRKAQNYAEVKLKLDNHSKKLQIDSDELVVTRRLYRSGESEYYLNNDRARLKDIIEIFLDSGLGKEAFSIISQGRVDEILNAKPIDRRQIIEESAIEAGASSIKDMGKVMAIVRPKTLGRADGKLVSQIVKEYLTNK